MFSFVKKRKRRKKAKPSAWHKSTTRADRKNDSLFVVSKIANLRLTEMGQACGLNRRELVEIFINKAYDAFVAAAAQPSKEAE